MGRDNRFRKLILEGKGFNPRARMGRDKVTSSTYTGGIVSIHAPAWGATLPMGMMLLIPLYVSIHAPAWGATP